ncbi:SDR family NAD(P)-dependent oxidoreductase [Nocardia aurantiaca]|nr:SDR family NAD(P)-dependent oxidoreductase [Nocardia aurantiaca]
MLSIFDAQKSDLRASKALAAMRNGLEIVRYGKLRGGNEPTPYEVVERRPMYRLRRYSVPESSDTANRPAVLMIPALMLTADLYDLDAEDGAVAMLGAAGVDPWVIDFGSPAHEEGGWQRDIADHVLAVSDAIDTVSRVTGRDVHLLGWSQGGMFAYQAAAYRRGTGVAGIITCGSPVDTDSAGLPWRVSPEVLVRTADFLADRVVSRMRVSDRTLRMWFKLLDPVGNAQRRLAFLRQLHDREALLPDERRRRFLAKDGWVGYPGPAIADLLRQFVADNSLLSGSFVLRDRLVTLSALTCPILAIAGKYDTIGTPTAVRAIGRSARQARVYEIEAVASHFGLVAGSGAVNVTWPAAAAWINWIDGDGARPAGIRDVAATSSQSAPDSVERHGGALSGRHVLITGGSSGIGRATALAAAAEGATVLLIARRGPELEQVVGNIRDGGGDSYGYQCDITDSESVELVVKAILDEHGKVDMLVNNAGRSIRRPLHLSTERLHDFERTMAVNYFGALRMTLAFLPQMRERRFGHIVNVSTGAVQAGVPRFSAYLASKAALNKFSEVAAAETLADGITFTTVHMPLVDTPMIAPNDYRAFKVRTPEWAAGQILKALVDRPKRITMTKAALWETWGLVAPRQKDRMMNRRFLDSFDSTH